ncbi:MAG: site-specific integrase [Deltaproteobacteria bacterium]|nr:site-specific integrase [Deltaproteobacteria bacterium]
MKNTYSLKEVVDYIPASLHETKHWEVIFYAKDPQSGDLRRKRMRIKKMKSITERRLYAKQIIFNVNKKLSQGWNPFIESDSARSYYAIFDVFDSFLKDKRTARHDTLRTYNSEIKFLRAYISSKHGNEMYAVSFDKGMAIEYMEHAWENREIGAVRYNNILAFCKLIFNWMIEKQYVKENPFGSLQKKKQTPKKRIMDIERKDRKKIKEFLSKRNRAYYCIMMFAFHSLLRPKEISYIKIGDIDLKKKTVTVKGNIAKNGNTRYAPIPNVMLDLVKELINEVPNPRNSWYLFSRDFKPGPFWRDSREIARYWSDLRSTLKLKKEIQFYSLRDSGIIQMLRDGRSPKEVMEAADHSSIEVTNNYVKVARKESNRDIINKSSAF